MKLWLKRNPITSGPFAVFVCILLVICIAIDLMKLTAGKLWLALIATSVVALVILLGLHFARAGDIKPPASITYLP